MRLLFAAIVLAIVGGFLFRRFSRKEEVQDAAPEKVEEYVCTLCGETMCDCHKVEDDAEIKDKEVE